MKYRLALAGTLVLATVFRVWGLTWGLYNATVSRRPHPDEWVVYWLFRWFDHNGNLDPCPRTGQCFFDWGTVFLYLGYAIRHVTNPVLALLPPHAFGPSADPLFIQAVLAGRVTSVVLSVLTVFLAYLFAARAYDPLAGILASLAVASSGLLIQLAHFATPDSTTAFLVVLTLLASLFAVDRPVPWLMVAGLAGGLALGTEYHMILLAIPVTVAWWLGPRRGWTLLSSAATFIAVAFATNVYALIHLSAWVDAFAHTVNSRTVGSAETYQNRFAPYGPSYLYVIRYPLGYGVGFALTACYLAGVVYALKHRRPADILLLSWLVPYFILVTVSSAKFMRYSAPLIPTLAIFAGALLSWLLQQRDVRFRVGVAALAVFAVAWTWVYDGAYVGLFASTDTRVAETNWLKHHVRPHSQIAFEMLPNGLFNLPYFVSAAGYRPCVANFKTVDLAGPMRYVVTDEYSLEDHHLISTSRVMRFSSALTADPRYKLVHRVHYVPTFLGLTFPIDGSPHDWRYPAHVIETYENEAPEPAPTACFATLAAAQRALYVPQAAAR